MMQKALKGPALVSICIPTYNRLEYLRDLLPDVMRQVEFEKNRLIEVIVSDNCSSDGTSSYLSTIDKPFFRWWTNACNIGGDRNFLKCIREARGKYVWLIGDDDLLFENAVHKVCIAIQHDSPDLIIAGTGNENDAVRYAKYRDFLLEKCRMNSAAALNHTLISANVFRRDMFDAVFADKKLYTQYAHMFGLMKGLTGGVSVVSNIVRTREVRAKFAEFPACLCIKQSIYLFFLATRFGMPRFRFYAIKNACNLPIEYLSRLKKFFISKMPA